MPNLLNQTLQSIQTTKTRYKQMLEQTEDETLQAELKNKIAELDKLEKETLCQINQ
mgnify:CR=1 FL=1